MITDHSQILFTVTAPCCHFCAGCIHELRSVDVQHFQSPPSNLLAMEDLRYGRLQSEFRQKHCLNFHQSAAAHWHKMRSGHHRYLMESALKYPVNVNHQFSVT